MISFEDSNALDLLNRFKWHQTEACASMYKIMPFYFCSMTYFHSKCMYPLFLCYIFKWSWDFVHFWLQEDTRSLLPYRMDDILLMCMCRVPRNPQQCISFSIFDWPSVGATVYSYFSSQIWLTEQFVHLWWGFSSRFFFCRSRRYASRWQQGLHLVYAFVYWMGSFKTFIQERNSFTQLIH